VEYKNISVVSPEGQEMVQKYMIMASPGIIINGELFSTGGFNRDKVVAKLKELTGKG
jgi:alkyl hydroperoxide reductase subunit AhpF